MPNCDNCGAETGYNDRNFTEAGGALCDRCRKINRIHVVVELSIDLLDRDPEEILGSIEAAPPNIHGMTIGGANVIASHVVRNGELAEVETFVSPEVFMWMWRGKDESNSS